ncbi:hypothetical protein BSKO_10483 [Bryopsis sp. KO-2023]|nr:hypothetical protein BSKO_10483 [Bryopsis sp. KO-2023]
MEVFPRDYDDLVRQAQDAVQTCVEDGNTLLEVEFPTASLHSVPGDGEGANEMSWSMDYLRRFCRMYENQGQAENVRIFFPDQKELALAVRGADGGSGIPRFANTPFRMDFLTKPTGLMDLGIDIGKVAVADRAKDTDEAFLIAYPSFNVNEMISVEELWQGAVKGTDRPIIVFNGELDRIRSGYYPSLFYPKIGKLGKNFLPLFTQAYYIHNFKGSRPGALFRCYPGPWQILRRHPVDFEDVEVIETREEMPTLKEVQLDVLSKY